MADLSLSSNKDKILDLILANQIEMREDISKIKDSVAKMGVIEHRLTEGNKKFEEIDGKLKEINMRCRSDGCLDPHIVTVLDKLKRHIGDMDYFFEKLNKTIEGERFFDILESISKDHVRNRKLGYELKNAGIKNMFGWATKIAVWALGIGLVAIIIMIGVQVVGFLSKITPLLKNIVP